MKTTFRLIPLTLCILAAFESSVALAGDNIAPACPPANDYVQAYNLPINLPAHTVYSVKEQGLTETLKIKTDAGWLLTIYDIYPDPNTPVKTIADISNAINAVENDTVINLQDSQDKIASPTSAKTDKWNGNKIINVWRCDYSSKNHPYSFAYAVLPRE